MEQEKNKKPLEQKLGIIAIWNVVKMVFQIIRDRMGYLFNGME